MSVENPDDILRRSLPNFMRAVDDMIVELNGLRQIVESHEDQSDDIEALKAENNALRAAMMAKFADREIEHD